MFRVLSCLAVMIPLATVCMGIVFGPAMAMAQPTPMPATSDEARVRQMADQFFAAYPKQDLDGLMALWSRQSPDYARRRQAMQDFFAASRDIQLKSLALTSVAVKGNTARVQVEVEIVLTDMTSGQPSPRVGQLQRVLYLVREDDMWKVWRYLTADLVQALWEATTEEERRWLLHAEKEQLTEAKLTGINEVAVEEAQQGRFERAERLNEIACQAAAVLGDTAQQGWCMTYQGMIFHHQARYPLAVDHFTQAQALFRTAADRRGDAVTLTNLGAAYGQMGRYAEALASFDARLKLDERDVMIKPEDLRLSGPLPQEVLQVLQEMPKFQDPITLSNMASLYQIMGQNDQAVRLFEASLKTVQGMQNETGKMAQMAALNNLGNVYHATSRYPEALKAYEESARLAQDLADKSGEAAALNNIGDVHRLTGSDAAAREVIEKSLKIAQTAGNQVAEAVAWTSLGRVHQTTARYGDALEAYRKALRIAEPIGAIDTVFRVHNHIGDVYYVQKQWQPAAEAYRQSIVNIELLRAQTGEQSLQTSFLGEYTAPYYHLASSLLKLQDAPQAFAVSEYAKARVLVDVLQKGKATIVKALSQDERREEQNLQANITALTVQVHTLRAVPHPDLQHIATVQGQLALAYAAHQEFRRRLYFARPELRIQHAQFEPVTLTRLNQTLFARQPDLVVLSYLVGEEETLLFGLTRGPDAQSPATLTVYPLPLTRAALTQNVREFLPRFATKGGRYSSYTRQLYQSLLARAEPTFTGKTHVVIIPDGVLHALPFQALLDGQDAHLIERYVISYAPSATALDEMLRVADQRREIGPPSLSLLALGHPTFPPGIEALPATATEVQEIGTLFGSSAKVLIGPEASEAAAKEALGQARYVHLATHGWLNDVAPLYSAVVLAQGPNDDGWLHAQELMDLELQAELMTLSACQTASGQEVSGEGILGLTWALFVAGTPSSIVTQWQVADESTSVLMRAFYRQLHAASADPPSTVSKVEALRQAQLHLMRDGQHAHPYYWAPFVLVGGW